MSNTPGESSGIVADRVEAQGNTPDWAKLYISQDPRLAKLMQDPAKEQEMLVGYLRQATTIRHAGQLGFARVQDVEHDRIDEQLVFLREQSGQ